MPDNWDVSVYALNSANVSEVPYTVNEITTENWAALEIVGAIFLPASGYRAFDNNTYYVGRMGSYWSSSFYDTPGCAWGVSFDLDDCYFGSRYCSNLHFAHPVRLVCSSIQKSASYKMPTRN